MSGPERLVVIAAGIGRYGPGSGLGEIACAQADARRFYETISNVGGPRFDSTHGGVFEDIGAFEFRSIVESVARIMPPGALLVVYFSGHGEYESGSVALVFADADGWGRGRLMSSEVAASARRAQVVLVLDCCSGGGALQLANQTDPILTPRVSVLASARLAGNAQFSAAGSAFTTALCRAMDAAADDGEDVTLLGLASVIERDPAYEGECLSNLAEGRSDVTIASRSADLRVPADLADRFVNRLLTAPPEQREMLWYSLVGLPDPARVSVLRAWSHSDRRAEPSWLVRRAVGSALGSLLARSPAKRGMIEELLESASWMDCAVGVIAARRNASDPAISARLRSIAESPVVMDLVWLAHLYLADLSPEALRISLSTALPETVWGAVELWDRYTDQLEAIASAVHERVIDAGTTGIDDGLATHVSLCGASALGLPGTVDLELISDPVATHLYSLTSRGEVAHPAGQWLLSALYGSWRGQVDADLMAATQHLSLSQTMASLELAARLPSVALRMAIFQDSRLLEIAPDARDAVSWGVRDPHPWVRRVAIGALGPSAIDEAFSDVVDRRRYPGMFDLVLTGRALGYHDWRAYAKRHDLSPLEMNALVNG